MTVVWSMVCMKYEIWSATDRIFCYFRPFFALLLPNNPKNQNKKKNEKNHSDIIILNTYNINDNHMMYGSWDMEHDRQNFWQFCVILCPFTSLTTQKIKISKKWKSAQRYHHFAQVPQKSWSYTISQI